MHVPRLEDDVVLVVHHVCGAYSACLVETAVEYVECNLATSRVLQVNSQDGFCSKGINVTCFCPFNTHFMMRVKMGFVQSPCFDIKLHHHKASADYGHESDDDNNNATYLRNCTHPLVCQRHCLGFGLTTIFC